MADIRNKINEVYSLEQLSSRSSVVHKVDPTVKLVSTLVFIVLTVSWNRLEFARLIPFIFYPVVLMALSDTPWSLVLKRVALALPFALFAGISNVFLMRNPAFWLGNLAVSVGILSLASILFRTFLCVVAILILVAVTPFTGISAALRRLHVPDIFVSLFEMTYRYIGALLSEAATMYTAYMLRSTEHKGLQLKHMGSFVGYLLIRSFDRAERVYSAMKCRGFALRETKTRKARLRKADYIYLAATTLPFILLRLFDITALFELLF